MSVEDNERIVDKALRGLNARDWETYGAAFAESLVVQAPGLTEPVKGREARVEWVQGIIRAFPDGQVEKRQVFGEGNQLCVEMRFSGTHSGPLLGPGGRTVAATHKKVEFPYCLVLKFDRGEISEVHEYFDQLEILGQLGLMQ